MTEEVFSQTKSFLRQSLIEKRSALNAQEWHDLSQSIQEKILHNLAWTTRASVGLYSPVKNEVDTTTLFMKALENGVSVYFPRVEQGLRFYEVKDPSDLQKGAWGILEPKHSCVPLPPDEKLEIVLIPGVAFDLHGFRIGYGKGFYDEVMDKISDLPVGLAYEFQLVEQIPRESWDRGVKRLVTEKKEYIFN